MLRQSHQSIGHLKNVKCYINVYGIKSDFQKTQNLRSHWPVHDGNNFNSYLCNQSKIKASGYINQNGNEVFNCSPNRTVIGMAINNRYWRVDCDQVDDLVKRPNKNTQLNMNVSVLRNRMRLIKNITLIKTVHKETNSS